MGSKPQKCIFKYLIVDTPDYRVEIASGEATVYYRFGGRAVAWRNNSGMRYVLADHLSSTHGETSSSQVEMGQRRYTPYGSDRSVAGANDIADEERFTSQRRIDSGGGNPLHELYHYGARWYLPGVGIFTQPDTIVPDYRNPQALNRFACGYNNPVKYVDPGGHNPIGADWEQGFEAIHGYKPSDQDRRARLFSVIFPGSGEGGGWTQADWDAYKADPKAYWQGTKGPAASATGLSTFRAHLARLASYYKAGEERLFAQAVGFVWGGVPLGNPVASAWQMGTNPGAAWEEYPPLYEGNEGFSSLLVDPGDSNQAHHYAGLFYIGYFFGPYMGRIVNWARDGSLSGRNEADIRLGDVASRHGALLAAGGIRMPEVALAVDYAISSAPGIWSTNTPGKRVPWWW